MKKRSVGLVMLSLVIALVFTLSAGSTASAKTKYSKYLGTWMDANSHDYEAALEIKKLSKHKIVGGFYVDGFYEKNGKIIEYKDSITINNKINIKKNKFKFKGTTKKGYKVVVCVRLGKKTLWKKFDMRKGVQVKVTTKKARVGWNYFANYRQMATEK